MNKVTNRREFLRSTGRLAALAGLGTGALVLGRRRRDSSASCREANLCGACPAARECALSRTYRQQSSVEEQNG